MTKCDYDCNNEALFKLKNGKSCCSSSANKCVALRAKKSAGLKIAYEEGRKQTVFSNTHRKKSLDVKRERSKEKFLTTNSNCSNHVIKKLLFETLNWENKCSNCDLINWYNKPITMELDHIDGNNSNNDILNLRLLCPNCHSQTSTYCGKSINTGKLKVSDEELINALKSSKNVRQALIAVKLTPKGCNYTRAYRLLSALKET